ncbi:hypothetical protein [Sulfuricurvum sp.]|uniref:hypothetical protein n=1 Tax=Sulfuricurvum sp. TaxID=2025608 RepID=UPI0035632A99
MAKFVETLVKQVLRQTPTKKGEATFTKSGFVQNTWYDVKAQGAKPSTFGSVWADSKTPYADVHAVFDLSNMIAGKVMEIEILRAPDGTNYRRHSLTTLTGAQDQDDIELTVTCTASMPIHIRWRFTDANASVDMNGRYWAIGGTQS